MTRALTFFGIILLVLLAMGQTTTAFQTPDATATMAATEQAISLANGWVLTSRETKDQLSGPDFTVTVRQPVLTGPTDPRIDHFNKAVDDWVTKSVSGFQGELRQLGTPVGTIEPPLPGSDFEVRYVVFTATDKLISIRFDVFYYNTGAAHPGSYSDVINYDVQNDKVLALKDLFKPRTNYLNVLSNYCAAQLKKKGTLAFPEGVQPKEANFKSWNIAPTGLQITFDDYQVAPHAVGPQEVLVPYSALKSIIDPRGALASFVK